MAAFYVGHPGLFYAAKMHSVDLLLTDAEKLRTEWKTGRVAPDVKSSKAPQVFSGTDYSEGVTSDGHA